MSSDLLEAFGNSSDQPPPAAPPKPSQGQSHQTSSFGDFGSFGTGINQPQQPWQQQSGQNLQSLEDDDDFGDFEDAHESSSETAFGAGQGVGQTTSQSSHHFESAVTGTTFPAPPSHNQPGIFQSGWEDATRHDPISAVSDHRSTRGSSAAFSRAKLDRIAPDPDVLFDASQPGDDDDFGDFEEGTNASAAPPVTQSNTQADLLGLQDDLDDLNIDSHQHGSTTAEQIHADFTGFQERPSAHDSGTKEAAARRPVKKSPAASFAISNKNKKVVPTPVKTVDDSWDEFADWEPTAPPPPAEKPSSQSPVTSITSKIESPLGAEPTIDGLPPTNVPPPAVLLSLFPPLFANAQAKLFKPLAAQPFQLKNRILSDPAVSEFLRGYLLLAVVAARVIAGRKYRWKRDAHLAQGMRIGPASSRGTSGMKLTGVDKGEVSKEDREGLDVVQAWREQVGRLRSAVAGVNSIHPTASLGPVPDLQETIPVRIAKADEGAATAPQPCALCGLKRNERVAKVDGDVDDSFGEWWVEKTSMHRGKWFLLSLSLYHDSICIACRNFWEAHQDTLRQR